MRRTIHLMSAIGFAVGWRLRPSRPALFSAVLGFGVYRKTGKNLEAPPSDLLCASISATGHPSAQVSPQSGP
jgi:hypothetical protein